MFGTAICQYFCMANNARNTWPLYGFDINVKSNVSTLSRLADAGVGGPCSRIDADSFSPSYIGSAVLSVLLVLVFGTLRCIPLNFER